MDKITKLSQAIRLGATFRPQIRDQYMNKQGSCALGAAMEALGITDWRAHHPRNLFYERFPEIKDKSSSGRMSILAYVIFLNDHSRWTREQIADWLETKGL